MRVTEKGGMQRGEKDKFCVCVCVCTHFDHSAFCSSSIAWSLATSSPSSSSSAASSLAPTSSSIPHTLDAAGATAAAAVILPNRDKVNMANAIAWALALEFGLRVSVNNAIWLLSEGLNLQGSLLRRIFERRRLSFDVDLAHHHASVLRDEHTRVRVLC